MYLHWLVHHDEVCCYNYNKAIFSPVSPQSELRSGGARLGELELINSHLSDQLTTLQSQLDNVTTQAEADKKAALEQ